MSAKMMKRLLLPALGVALVVLLAFQAKSFGGANITPRAQDSGSANRVVAQGNVAAYPGARVEVGTDVAGVVERVAVQEKDVVRKGDVLIELDAREARSSLEEARARVSEAEADIRLYEEELARARGLWTEQVGTRQAVDRCERDLAAARARRASGVATVARLETTVAKMRIISPIDGVVIHRDVNAGEAIQAGRAVATIADVSKLRIEAEVDEFDSARLHANAPALIRSEGFGGQSWQGVVEEIPDSVVPRKLIAQDPARATDAAVLLVKIAIKGPHPLRLGQRVDVEIR